MIIGYRIIGHVSAKLLRVTICNTVPLDLNFTYARAQKATARNIHGNALE